MQRPVSRVILLAVWLVAGAIACSHAGPASPAIGTVTSGVVTAVPPVTSAGQFLVSGTTITTTPSTSFKTNGQPGLFSDIQVGALVHVKGRVSTSGSSVVATTVTVQRNR